MSDFLRKIFSPQIHFEANDDTDKLIKFFCDLYRIEIFKDGLDLILTKLKEKDLRFEIKIIKGWDTNLGCYLTEQEKFSNKIFGNFSSSIKKKIILRQITHNLMAHEMAHALEFESGLSLDEDFRTAIGYDMKNRSPSSLPLKGEIKRLMVDALKSYKPHQFLSELFARYFELLSVSRNVHATGDFATSDVMEFFENTTNFITKIFNPQIRSKIDPEIARITTEIATRVHLTNNEPKFQERVGSFQKKTGGQWSKGVKSNAMWQAGWDKYQKIEEKKGE